MAKFRRNRINDAVKEELAQIIRNVKDPRVADAFVSITGAEVSGDLKFAKIYFSVMTGDKNEVLKGLKNAQGFLRSELAKRLNLRQTPQLAFEYDGSDSEEVHRIGQQIEHKMYVETIKKILDNL